ncbi:MarR family transcriptional regulator [Streptosporangiaceae bacterium NEAU-GS5]|nr:MarR family transcriptional regulator [Streptosporangiaceae bacterium NEAU-GS5]
MTAQPGSPGPGLDIVDGIVQLSFRVQEILAETGAEHDLSMTQLRLLGILRDRDAEMLQLAAYLGLDKSSVTGLVTRAERRDLLRRLPSPRDRRATLVTLTAHGRDLVADGERRIRAQIAALTAPLTAPQQDALTALLAQILGTPAP